MLLQTLNLQQLDFVQGDTAVLGLQATDDIGNLVNITGASFSTQILSTNGDAPAQFGNGQHAITNAALGQFTLTLATTDTPNCGLGLNKEILTTITIGLVVQTYRGVKLLNVYSAVPEQ